MDSGDCPRCPQEQLPARLVVKPALSQVSTRAEMSETMLSACAAANAGNLPALTSALEDAGRAGVDGIHAYIDKGIPPPNSPITLKGGWMHNPFSKKPVHIKGKSGTTSRSVTHQAMGCVHPGTGAFVLGDVNWIAAGSADKGLAFRKQFFSFLVNILIWMNSVFSITSKLRR